MDHIFSLIQITDKTLQQSRTVYTCFVDLEKVFDNDPRKMI